MRNACLFLFLIFLGLSGLWGQNVPADSVQTDSTQNQEVNQPADDPRTFSLVFNRGFIYQPNNFQVAQDTVPINGTSSGTFFLGAGIMVPFGRNVIGLRMAPGFAWTIYDYGQTSQKTFPTPIDEDQPLLFEKHRTQWVELPVGLYWNVSRDEDADPLFFVELGGYAGYMVSAQYRAQFASGARTITLRESGLEQEGDFQRLRYGLYARAGYKWFALYAAYRLSSVWDEFGSAPGQGAAFRNPTGPPIEIGLSLLW
jgi:hypothetical protein